MLALPFLVLGWGYWHAATHAYLQFTVGDHALKTPTLLYGTPHGVTLVLRDAANGELATARSVEPAGYVLALHPDPGIGNCEHLREPGAHSDCYGKYSAWSATWASKVRHADVKVGSCEIRGVPVEMRSSNDEWLLWWVPLPHIGGIPRQYFGFTVMIDSRACAAVRARASGGRTWGA